MPIALLPYQRINSVNTIRHIMGIDSNGCMRVSDSHGRGFAGDADPRVIEQIVQSPRSCFRGVNNFGKPVMIRDVNFFCGSVAAT